MISAAGTFLKAKDEAPGTSQVRGASSDSIGSGTTSTLLNFLKKDF